MNREAEELAAHVAGLEKLREVLLHMEREAMRAPVVCRLFLHVVAMATSVMDPDDVFELEFVDGGIILPRAREVRSVVAAILTTRAAGPLFREPEPPAFRAAGTGPLILGLDPAECDGVYPRTRDGRCHGCGSLGAHPRHGPNDHGLDGHGVRRG